MDRKNRYTYQLEPQNQQKTLGEIKNIITYLNWKNPPPRLKIRIVSIYKHKTKQIPYATSSVNNMA